MIKSIIKLFTNRNRTFYKVLFSFIAIIALVGIYGGYYVYQSRYIKKQGIIITPSKDYPIHDVEYYLQNDKEWSSDTIGNSKSSMGSTGCLITCVASSLTDLGEKITPKELNQQLSDVEGFQGADLIWYKINEIIPSIEYSYSRVFNNKTIEGDLENDRLPLINVKFYGNGVTHWVVVVGAKDGDFLVYDPANKNKEPIPLSTHGKVYAYRVLHKTQ